MNKFHLSNKVIRNYGAMAIALTVSVFLLINILCYCYYSKDNSDFIPYTLKNYRLLVIPVMSFFCVYFPINKMIKNHIPEDICCKNRKEIYNFMEQFISTSTSRVTIVSNSLNWLNELEAKNVKYEIFKKINAGIQIEIIVSDIQANLENELKSHHALIYKRELRPMSRFTVINSSKPNAAKLAIAKGSIPNHMISVYTYNDNSHIIDLALDMICQTKGENHQ